MRIEIDHEFCLPVVHVGGRVHEGNFGVLDQTLAKVSAEGHQMVALDLSEVREMGQSEAQGLLQVRQRMSRGFQRLTLIGLSPSSIEALSKAASSTD